LRRGLRGGLWRECFGRICAAARRPSPLQVWSTPSRGYFSSRGRWFHTVSYKRGVFLYQRQNQS
ncbi:MAG: hypothetical protein ACPIOQ_46250, partial [Promethearchaeia archaeon]